jgi:NADP-reducing hydrogenase subunit HndC
VAQAAMHLKAMLLSAILKMNWKQKVFGFCQVIMTGCFGFCEKGPIVKVMPDNTFYVQVKPEDAQEIVEEHVIKGRKVTGFFINDPAGKRIPVTDSKHMGFLKNR